MLRIFGILFCFINYTFQIYLILDPFEINCISKELLEKEKFIGSYLFSGKYEERNKACIQKEGQEIWRQFGAKNATFNFIIEKRSCFLFIY